MEVVVEEEGTPEVAEQEIHKRSSSKAAYRGHDFFDWLWPLLRILRSQVHRTECFFFAKLVSNEF